MSAESLGAHNGIFLHFIHENSSKSRSSPFLIASFHKHYHVYRSISLTIGLIASKMPHSASTIETDGKVTMAQYTLSERESSQYETKKDGRPVTIRPMLAITKWLQTIETESPAKRCLLSYERSYRGQIVNSLLNPIAEVLN